MWRQLVRCTAEAAEHRLSRANERHTEVVASGFHSPMHNPCWPRKLLSRAARGDAMAKRQIVAVNGFHLVPCGGCVA
jgi:hypothetical protein